MTPRVFTFTAPMPGGPWRKLFACPVAFDAYVKNWRENFGETLWLSPLECRGAM